MLVLLFAFLIWLWAKVPYMVNPWAVSAGIKEGTLPESTAILMAVILPVVMLTFLIFTIAVVLLAFVAFSNERRLIRIVRKLEATSIGNKSS